MEKTFYDADKGDRFHLYNKDGEIIRGVCSVDLTTGIYVQYYINNPCFLSKKKVKIFPKLKQENGLKIVTDVREHRVQFLRGLIDKYGWKHGAEIGVSAGRTTRHLLNHCPNLNMIAVDFWPSVNEDGFSGFDKKRVEFFRNLRPYLGNRLRMIEKPSVEAVKLVEDDSLDFVFIDASHDEKNCTADIQAWSPKVKSDGMLLGHDFNWDTVKLAVEKTINKYDVWWPDNVWWAWKKDVI